MVRVILVDETPERTAELASMLSQSGFDIRDITDSYTTLKSELDDVRSKLTERKLVERAKGILMKSRNLAEDQAYRTLRKLAMDRNLKLAEVARQVIDVTELLADSPGLRT